MWMQVLMKCKLMLWKFSFYHSFVYTSCNLDDDDNGKCEGKKIYVWDVSIIPHLREILRSFSTESRSTSIPGVNFVDFVGWLECALLGA